MGYDAWEPDADERATADPSWTTCACCDQLWHRTELADDGDDVADALAKRERGPICSTCAEDHALCVSCNALIRHDHSGPHGWLCEDCWIDETPEGAAADRAHIAEMYL